MSLEFYSASLGNIAERRREQNVPPPPNKVGKSITALGSTKKIAPPRCSQQEKQSRKVRRQGQGTGQGQDRDRIGVRIGARRSLFPVMARVASLNIRGAPCPVLNHLDIV